MKTIVTVGSGYRLPSDTTKVNEYLRQTNLFFVNKR